MTALLVSHDPSTGEAIGEVEITPEPEVREAVARVRAAQPAWAALGAKKRAEILAGASAVFEARAEVLAELISREMGKPLREAAGEVAAIAELAEDLAEMVAAFEPEVREEGSARSTIYRDALGVAAAITPWNFPMMMPHWMVLPALMAGNGVVLKPSEETPLCGQAYADVLGEVLPEGVLEVVHGADAQGKALVAADVDLIAFTGSREAGKAILAAASHALKRVVLELGGKDPLVVLEGADLAAAAKFAANNSFRNAGQVCVSTERIYVEAPIAEAFVEALVEHTRAMTVGDPREPSTKVGPMVNARQRTAVRAQVDDAVVRGATLVFAQEAVPSEGAFLGPIVLTDVSHAMPIMRDETFGPVACVQVVADADAAVAAANDTPFGLGAVVFGPEERAAAVARRLTAGMIGVNRSCGGATGTPWVGARQSGYGFHSSIDGHRQFAQTRVLTTTSS